MKVGGLEGEGDNFRFYPCWSSVTHTLHEAQTEFYNSSQKQAHNT
jgi:hypothetical protein